MSGDLLRSYRQALEAGESSVREEAAIFAGMSELEWQARWFAGEFGREWPAVDGATIHIEDFGRWNREPGPDFVDARVRIGDRELRGAVELDLDVRDWEHHAHAVNPSFRGTVLHVFLNCPARRCFTRTCDHHEVAQLHLPAIQKAPSLRLPDAPALSCERPRMLGILHAAARHRLDLKARALRRHAQVHGEDDAWFSALAVALGYKNNQTPFLLLAQRTGLRVAAEPSGEAQLFGVAGFLESPPTPSADQTVREYLRALWEDWWSRRASCERLILPASAWRLAGVRPANHPHRRIAALTQIATNWPSIQDALAGARRKELVTALESLTHPFWTTRFNLQAAPLTHPQALVGAERILDILINIYHPLAIERNDDAWSAFLVEKGPAPAAIMRQVGRRFFGSVADEKGALSSAAAQQGLLQLERDYRAAVSPGEFLSALRRLPVGSTVPGAPC